MGNIAVTRAEMSLWSSSARPGNVRAHGDKVVHRKARPGGTNSTLAQETRHAIRLACRFLRDRHLCVGSPRRNQKHGSGGRRGEVTMKRTPLIGRTGRARPRPDDDRGQHALGPAEEAARRAVQEESRARTGGSGAGHGLCVAVTAVLALAAVCAALPATATAQQRDTTARPTDSLKVYTLPPVVVSVTRTNPPINQIPQSVSLVGKREISRARPTWGLDEALATVPGVYAANRYNFSLDQRISIRGFGARSAFAVRGIKVLLDGIPQTLPDGQGQLTNLELGAADRIEVLRGSSSALFGNASGGVISIWSDPAAPRQVVQEIRFTGGTFDRHELNIFNPYSAPTWYKWETSTQFRAGSGSGLITLSQLAYNGERQHSRADIRNLNGRFHFPLAPAWSLAVVADYGNDPRADNPGSLTAQEMAANPDSAAGRNITLRAGKDVWQAQGGATLRHTFAAGGEATLTLFGLRRDLKNPTTFAYIDLSRSAYGARFSLTRLAMLARDEARITTGVDLQRQRDDRLNLGNSAGRPDSTVRILDQLEHVTEVGPFAQLTLQVAPQVSVTGGLRYDWVQFAVDDRLVTPSNPDDSGRRLMNALSGSLGAAVTPSDAVTVYGNVGTSFETPTTTELTNRPGSAGGFHPDPQPPKATTYQARVPGEVIQRLPYSPAPFPGPGLGQPI